jgi:2-methylisocitrate lyase-like PEP mutase family enzyme
MFGDAEYLPHYYRHRDGDVQAESQEVKMGPVSAKMSPSVMAFRALHESGCFVLPNPWDVGTAVYLRQLGFKALATTSAGFAFSHGLPDSVAALPRDVMLAHIREMVGATPLPLNADFQTGYARDPEGVAANVALCVETGIAGLSIEDASGDNASPLFERALAIDRIRAARAAIDASGTGVILTARCEAWLVGVADPLPTSLDRLVAFAQAGADCLYAPGVRDPETIAAIVRAVAPKPVNVLMSAPVAGLSVERLSDLGVRRISVGSALARAAWGGFIRAAKEIAETGSFDGLADAAPFGDLNGAFGAHG